MWLCSRCDTTVMSLESLLLHMRQCYAASTDDVITEVHIVDTTVFVMSATRKIFVFFPATFLREILAAPSVKDTVTHLDIQECNDAGLAMVLPWLQDAELRQLKFVKIERCSLQDSDLGWLGDFIVRRPTVTNLYICESFNHHPITCCSTTLARVGAQLETLGLPLSPPNDLSFLLSLTSLCELQLLGVPLCPADISVVCDFLHTTQTLRMMAIYAANCTKQDMQLICAACMACPTLANVVITGVRASMFTKKLVNTTIKESSLQSLMLFDQHGQMWKEDIANFFGERFA